MGAQAETRCQKTSSVAGAGARGIARPRARAADDLSAQGSGLRARQAKGGSHAPEIPTPTPAVNLRFNIDGLSKGLEGVGGLLVDHLSARLKRSRSNSPWMRPDVETIAGRKA